MKNNIFGNFENINVPENQNRLSIIENLKRLAFFLIKNKVLMHRWIRRWRRSGLCDI
jgi:hypothetical protein